ncbi:hypothetical protein CTheo_8686 [Ceratobasidium theobromae]|uniref:Uncharacterized protein n=1 Tax=Ceratobasidium theobromae TaxID=1582974 RepID=A0A5N5Q8P3_9AGAM|nr:hypothetical protein CTheo_8686 [Ceratobasidium theobromae]
MSQRPRTFIDFSQHLPPSQPILNDIERALVAAKAMIDNELSPKTLCNAFFQLGPVLNFRDFPADTARIERHCLTLAPPKPSPVPPPPTVSDGDASESWATVTSRSKKPRAPKATAPSAPPPPPAKAKPTEKLHSKHNRVVIHIDRKTSFAGQFSGEEALLSTSRSINSALASAGQATRCLGVRHSSFGNLIVIFPSSTSRNAAVATFEPIRAALQLLGDSRYPDAYVHLSLDCHWSFLSMANVPTRAPDSSSLIYNPAQLLAENLTKSRSSIAFAFEDPTSALVDRLRREVFLFGASVSVKPWSPSKPTANRGTAPPN